MSAREYEPGTVAVATVRGVPNVRVFRSGNGWQGPNHWLADSSVTDVRPLVVLELVAHPQYTADCIRRMVKETGRGGAILNCIADQIEAQIRPPKPAEPNGLGAVVEDADGRRWLRDHFGDGAWFWAEPQPGSDWLRRPYADIDAVRVLSEGVSA